MTEYSSLQNHDECRVKNKSQKVIFKINIAYAGLAIFSMDSHEHLVAYKDWK